MALFDFLNFGGDSGGFFNFTNPNDMTDRQKQMLQTGMQLYGASQQPPEQRQQMLTGLKGTNMGLFGDRLQNAMPQANQVEQANAATNMPQLPQTMFDVAQQQSVQPAMGSLAGDPQERLQQVVQAAAQTYPDNPTMQQVATSQAILESGLMNDPSQLATDYNNLFGIKGSGTAGSKNLPTRENINGRNVNVRDSFARNRNLADSFAQHRNLMQNPRYEGVMGASNPADAFRLLQQAGYATDPNYRNKLSDVHQQYVSPFFSN